MKATSPELVTLADTVVHAKREKVVSGWLNDDMFIDAYLSWNASEGFTAACTVQILGNIIQATVLLPVEIESREKEYTLSDRKITKLNEAFKRMFGYYLTNLPKY